MKSFFNIQNWSRLRSDDGDYKNFLEQRRNILFSRFCLTGFLAAVLQGIHDVLTGFPFVMVLDLILAVLLLTGYFLNERRFHKFSKLTIFTGIMILLFGFAAIVPPGVGIYLLFFPIVAFSFISLDYHDRYYSFSLAVLALILNVLLVITDYQPFGDINVHPADPTSSFAINLVISIGLLVLGIDFLLRISKQAEDQLLENQLETEKLAFEINEKNISLEKTNEELDRFVYSTSHDLRSPLASIMGLINLTEISDEPIPKEVQKYLSLIKDRVNNLDGFIQDIIDYSRNSRVELNLTSIDVNKIIDDVILNSSYLENASHVKITKEVEIESQLQLDHTRLSRVLNNLLSNAIKYNDLQKENPCVSIKAKLEDSNLIIHVSDTGKGIRPEIQDRIFEMFYRGTEITSGSGLGLYITREMVQKMNGQLSFTTEPNKGTTFQLSIPTQVE